MTTVFEQIQLTTEECCNCGTIFAITNQFYHKLKNEGGTFYCPRGHGQHYTKSENQKLKEQLEEKERELRTAKCTILEKDHNLQAAAEREAKSTRKLARVQRGVCPDCKRSFTNLHRHMASKHPAIGEKPVWRCEKSK